MIGVDKRIEKIHPKFQANHYINSVSLVSVTFLEAMRRLSYYVGKQLKRHNSRPRDELGELVPEEEACKYRMAYAT